MSVRPAERLALLITTSGERFHLALKESSPTDAGKPGEKLHRPDVAVLKESDGDGVFEYMVHCHPEEAVALIGILTEGDPNAQICATVDGEYILKDAPMAKVSPAEFPDGFLPIEPWPEAPPNLKAAARAGFPLKTDLFLAETPEGTRVGYFLPNGTHIRVLVSAPHRAMVTLRTSLYTTRAHKSQHR